MSIWKKIAGMLFEETDNDVIVEDELEDLSFPEEEITAQKKKPSDSHREIKEEPVIKEVYKEEIVKSDQETSIKEPVKKFVSIEVSEENAKKDEKPLARSITRSDNIRGTGLHEEKQEFEFSPVISPIFGSKDEAVVKKSDSLSITLPKPKRANPLGTVISPYYGVGELEEFKEEAQENIDRKEKSLLVDLPKEELDILADEEDINSLSLDDLIMDNDTEEDEDDMMQISLFGETTPLRDSDDEAIE